MSTARDEVVLYYNPMSRARIAHWMLEEVGAPYRLELVRFDTREHKADAMNALERAVSPGPYVAQQLAAQLQAQA